MFPRLCISCHEELPSNRKLLCAHCFDELELIDPLERCPFCFSEAKEKCESCKNRELTSDYIASCFEYFGTAKELILALKWREKPYLTKSLASFMYIQFCRLEWPRPDYIFYIPQSPSRAIQRGYNQSFLLAREFSLLIQAPLFRSVYKKETAISQAQLDLNERKQLPYDLFSITNGTIIEDKRILIIDDVYTTGTTIERMARAIQKHHPKKIYVVTVCRN